MAEFTPITLNTQEEVNKFFGDRAKQAKSAAKAELEQEYKEKYSGYEDYKAKAEKYDADVAALNEKITALEGEKSSSAARISELETKNREYETNSVKMRIAREAGLPAEFAERLNGEDEKTIQADAEKMAKLFKGQNVAPMYRQNGEGETDGKDAALKNLLQKVRNKD